MKKHLPKKNVIEYTYTNDNDEEVTVDIPAKNEVCPRCDGEGVHDHPAFANGISGEEWEQDWDEDSREMYRAGLYDVPCEECRGNKVVLTPDWQAEWPGGDEMKKQYEEHLEDEAYYQAECAAERRMGA